jgi:hypothetical protein
MLQPSDYSVLKQKGITESQVMDQLQVFATGFPMLKIIRPATPFFGILQCTPDDLTELLNYWDAYLEKDKTIVKFVPASGAASRMFKDLFEFLDGDSEIPVKKAEKEFFEKIANFAFYDALSVVCLTVEGKDIPTLMSEQKFKVIVDLLLNDKGLNYGVLPKGLLLFHSYADENRTPVQEHLAEGALYAMNKDKGVNVHFTVSGEHRKMFESHVDEIMLDYASKFFSTFQLTFSEQKSSTDTIAADEDNLPFRDKGELLFRPGGHGALIENLNDLDADVIFIKNIDNVVPDALKEPTIIYKKMIAGLLVKLQQETFNYLKEMDENPRLTDEKLADIAIFCEYELNNTHLYIGNLQGLALQHYLRRKLNRPIRVCGMVKNTGEPGGGPFLTVNQDGTISTQILESSQINLNDPGEQKIMKLSTHFNPVDLVCGVKNYKGEKFDLLQYVDKNTGFISLKSKNGKALKALELPGLWNGAMSDWNTIFVEVPIATFNPVKTVNDLLREEHQ